MAKTIIKEVIIVLLLCLAILLILAVLLYPYIPNNKVIPEVVAYSIPEDAKEVISETAADTSKVVLSYEINSSDISQAQRANVYNPGKVDPFAAYTPPATNTTDGGTAADGSSTGGSTSSGSTGGTSTGGNAATGEGTVNGSTTGGTGTYYTNNGNK